MEDDKQASESEVYLLEQHFFAKGQFDTFKQKELSLRNKICDQVFKRPEQVVFNGSLTMGINPEWKVSANFKYSVEVMDQEHIDHAFAQISETQPDLAPQVFQPEWRFSEELFDKLDQETQGKIKDLCFECLTKIDRDGYEKLSEENKAILSDFVKIKRSQPTIAYKQVKKAKKK